MDNSVINTLSIAGPNSEIQRFKSQAEGYFCGRGGSPVPVCFQVNNFNTKIKRKCYYSDITSEEDEAITYSFTTTGFSVTALIKEISKNYPLLRFVFEFEDPFRDTSEKFIFQAGKVVDKLGVGITE